MRQFVVEKNPDKKGILIIDDKKKYHYLTSVLRMKTGDMIYVRLPDGELQNMAVAKIDEKEKKIKLQIAGENVISNGVKAVPVAEKNNLEITLFQFIPKSQNLELIIRQAVECGVSNIVLIDGEFCQKGNVESVKKHLQENDERFGKIITEAMQQSGSPVNTKISGWYSVEKSCDLFKEYCNVSGTVGFCLYEQSEGSKLVHQVVKETEEIKHAVIVCGAEGGISPDEVKMYKECGFNTVHFQTNILRCETAALYGISCIQSAVLEKKIWM